MANTTLAVSQNNFYKFYKKNMPAKSKKQRRLMGMVTAVKEGKMKAPSAKVKEMAKKMNLASAKDFAKTKEKKLPEKKTKKKK